MSTHAHRLLCTGPLKATPTALHVGSVILCLRLIINRYSSYLYLYVKYDICCL